jgi:hypothetical protein
MATMSEQVVFTRDQIVAKFVELRDEIDAKEAAHKAEIAKLKERQGVIENYLLSDMVQKGETSFSTSAGTAFIKTSEYLKVADKSTFVEFVKQQDDLNFLTVSASKTHCLEYKENTGHLPPGLNYTAVKEVQIRRGKSK